MEFQLSKLTKHIKLFVVTVGILLCTIQYSQSQNPYYDASHLASLVDPDGNIDLKKKEDFIIINRYLSPQKNRTHSEILQDWKDSENPFFQLTKGALADQKEISQINQIPTGISRGLNITNVADGLAKFLVERAKQELSITFFDKFKEVLENPNNKDFKVLFPKTYDVLIVINKEVYQFSNYLNTLKEAFENDLKNMLIRLEPFLKDKKTALFKKNLNDPIGQKIEYFESALLLVNNLRQGVHPAEAIGKLENQKYHPNNTPLLNVQEAAKLFNIFSNSLKSTETDRFWIDSNSLKSLLNPTTFNIYLGLLYQLHGNEMIFNKKFSSYLDSVVDDTTEIQKYQDYIKQLVVDSEQITLAIQSIKQKTKDGEKVDSYKDIFHATLSFIEQLDNAKVLNPNFTIKGSSEVIQVMGALNDIYLDLNERKYNALILDLSRLLTQLLGEDKFGWKDELIKYGSFIANVAQAENSNQVQSAIEAIALPAGSASIKKRSKSNIALNAYLGISPGIEHNGDTDKSKFALGLNAPIGIAASWGHGLKYNKKCKCNKEQGSSSVFISLIDLGAVTTYRFADSETENIPEIEFENILAPGAYYVYGLPKLPISIGLGGQFGPRLREITDDTISLNSKISFSFKLFIAVDIPLLNFYTKSR